MHKAQDHYPECPETMIVGLARSGDRRAFEELVRRRQSSIRNLMRRCCRDVTLADDLAQQVFLQVMQFNLQDDQLASAFQSLCVVQTLDIFNGIEDALLVVFTSLTRRLNK